MDVQAEIRVEDIRAAIRSERNSLQLPLDFLFSVELVVSDHLQQKRTKLELQGNFFQDLQRFEENNSNGIGTFELKCGTSNAYAHTPITLYAPT
jgi:hypothetical protein